MNGRNRMRGAGLVVIGVVAGVGGTALLMRDRHGW